MEVFYSHQLQRTGKQRVVRIVLLNAGLLISFVGFMFSLNSSKKRLISETTSGTSGQRDTTSKSSACEEQFNLTVQDNLSIIKQYPRGVADAYMWKIGGKLKAPAQNLTFPVIVTAFSRRYYPQSMGLFKSVHKYVIENGRYAGKTKLIVYDLGLTDRQTKMLNEHCQCELRKFPFEEFPPHVKELRTYAFKPIIIQMLLMEFGFVWWADTSVRFTRYNIDDLISFSVRNSILFFVNYDVSISYPIARQTDIRTFDYLNEDRCKFRALSETSATTVIFHFDEVSKTIVNAWAACALNSECIAPEGSRSKLFCDIKQKEDGRCHRFDQSVLSILTRRLYHATNEYPLDKKVLGAFEIKRAVIEKYFDYCNPIFICLA